jgi:hypothetical protein
VLVGLEAVRGRRAPYKNGVISTVVAFGAVFQVVNMVDESLAIRHVPDPVGVFHIWPETGVGFDWPPNNLAFDEVVLEAFAARTVSLGF